MSEVDLIRERYARRKSIPEVDLNNPLRPERYLAGQELDRSLIRLFKRANLPPLSTKKVLEIGCGSGSNLLRLLRFGFDPHNLIGNELIQDNIDRGISMMPSAIKILVGDASELDLTEESFDILMSFTVFSSILNLDFQEKLASKMWLLTKPGGGILWFDFIYNNPNNSDVMGIKVKRLQKLFPEGQLKIERIALAPPIARQVTKIHPRMYTLFNLFPFLRTHILVWIQKPLQ
jgi:SAM-dependent methyltransferase